jgi:hypothetical protein
LKAALAAGIPFGMTAGSMEEAQRWLAKGCSFVTFGSDFLFIRARSIYAKCRRTYRNSDPDLQQALRWHCQLKQKAVFGTTIYGSRTGSQQLRLAVP